MIGDVADEDSSFLSLKGTLLLMLHFGLTVVALKGSLLLWEMEEEYGDHRELEKAKQAIAAFEMAFHRDPSDPEVGIQQRPS